MEAKDQTMNVIFLDIDGVLNSWQYDYRYRTACDGNIDETRLELLRYLAEKTQAKIVLSSSWRKHWNKDKNLCDLIGIDMDVLFSKHKLIIFDKTPELPNNDRPEEIRMWLKQNKETTRFVILDDIRFGWGNLQENLVNTNYRIGRGLEDKHISEAIRILIE